MAISHTQGVAGNSVAGTLSPSPQLTGVAAGALLTFQFCGQAAAGNLNIASITDSTGDTWTAAEVPAAVSGIDAEIWYRSSGTSTGTHTLTVTVTYSLGGANATYTFDEWAGSSGILDQINRGTVTGTNSPAPSVTPTQNNELVISCAQNTGNAVSNPASGWTALSTSGTTDGLGAYQIQTTATATSATFTGASAAWTQVIATFKVPATTNAPAGLAAETTAALDAKAAIAPNAGQSAVTAAGVNPSTAIVTNPTVANAAIGSPQSTPMIGPAAGLAAGTWGANNATVVTSGNTNAQAGRAAVTASALGPSASISPHAGIAAGTWAANAATIPDVKAESAVIPVLNPFQMVEVVTPSASDTGTMKLYFKADELLYSMDPAGVERPIDAASTSYPYPPIDVAAGVTFVVPSNMQVLYRHLITVEGTIQVNGSGLLVSVS